MGKKGRGGRKTTPMAAPTAAKTPALPLPTRPIDEPPLYPTVDFNAMDLVWSSRVGPVGSDGDLAWRSSGEIGRLKCSSTLRHEESGMVSVIEKTLATWL